MSEPSTPTSTPKGLTVLLQTRCGCEKAMEIAQPIPPRTVTVQLAPIPPQLGGKPNQEPEKRVFYLVAKGQATVNSTGEKVDAYLYIEGPNPDKPRILVPGAVPIDRRIHGR